MADLNVRVRLTGEAGQLVGQLKGVAASEKEVADEAQRMAAAAGQAAAATDRMGTEAGQAAAAERQLAAASGAAERGTLQLTNAMARAAQQSERLKRSNSATGAGLQGLGVQFGDFTQQLALGTPVFLAFGQQAGQAAFALQSVGGVAGTVGRFLAGPFGSLILAAVTVVGTLAFKADQTKESLQGLEVSSYAVKDAQGILGNVMDVTTGKITNQIPAVLALARAQLVLAQVQSQTRLAAARSDIAQSKGASIEQRAGLAAATQVSPLLGLTMRALGAGREAPAGVRQTASQFENGFLTSDQAIKRLQQLQREGTITADVLAKLSVAYANVGVETANQSVFAATERMLDGKGTAADRGMLLRPDKGRKSGGKSGADEAEKLARFGSQAAESISRITEQFDEQPRLVDRVNQATRQLDALIADLNKKQPKGFREMIAEAQRAKAVVQESLLRPFNDFVEAQQRSRDVQALQLAGREDEAQALQVIFRLQDQVGTVTKEQRETILAIVRAEEKQNELLARRSVIVNAYNDQIQDARSSIEQLLSGNLSGKDFLKNIVSSYRQAQAKIITEQLFGPMFRELEKEVQERTGIKSAVDIFKAGTESAGKSGATMATALEKAAGRVDRLFGGGAAGEPAFDPASISPEVRGQLGSDWDAVVDGLAASGEASNEIAVTARRLSAGVMGLPPTSFLNLLINGIAGPLVRPLERLLGPRLTGQLQGIAVGAAQGFVRGGIPGGILGAADAIPKLSEAVDKLFKTSGVLKGAVAGAETGTMVAGITKALGIKTSTTGAQIGGAIGSALPIPGGEIIGSLLGGLAGGLFKKAKTGTATITNVTDAALLGGSSGKFRTAAGGLAGSVQQGLQSLADQLGASIGDFAVSIGIRDGKFRVDPSGRGNTKTSKGAIDFGKDGEDAAIRAAIADAVRDGALTGISAAMQKALQAFSDPEKGLAEALKVRDLEVALGGFTGAAREAFLQFERQAKDRLRIATAYGFEVSKVEELNARERLKLREQLEQQSFGSLQALLQRMRSGDLFEGSAVDQRTALLAQIDTVRGKAAAGEEGAADQLAQLLEQLNTISKDVFGTSGGFAGDRSSIEATAENVIGLLRAKLDEAAAGVSNPQLDTTNALLDENSDQNAQMIAALNAIRDGLGSAGALPGAGWTMAELAGLAYTGNGAALRSPALAP